MPISRQVKKGQTLLYQGEVPSSVFAIKKGLVRALNVNSGGGNRRSNNGNNNSGNNNQ